jgi:Glycosyl transferase family 2
VCGPTWRIAFLFHSDLDLFARTLPRCVEALTASTTETFEVVLLGDGTPDEVAAQLPKLLDEWGVDEVQLRSRRRHVASGDASNNGHRRFFPVRSPYLIVVEDDVVMYRTEQSFDVLASCRTLFEQHRDVPVLSKVNDHDQWSWKLLDIGPEIEPGVRSVSRLSTHFIAYDVARFAPVAERFGGFDLDVFIDRDDRSYNWEDLVSHVGTTGGRRIAFPESWPLDVYHCDRKVEPGSMYHTQRPEVKAEVLARLEERYRPGQVRA